jgi:hypothetical protein
MRIKQFFPAALVLLAACGTVVDERRTTAVLSEGFNQGERYDIVTQTVQGPNGTYERTRVVYWGRSAPCILDSPRDCEFAARRLVDQRFSSGLF